MPINTSSIRCSSQVALLGAVTPNLRSVAFKYTGDEILLLFYYEYSPNENEVELAEKVASELIADFPDYMIETEKIVLPTSERIPFREDFLYLYLRYESSREG